MGQSIAEIIIKADVVAIDSSQIDAYERARPKSRLPEDETTGSWGAKRDTHGNQITWLGYKPHVAVDAKSELPLSIMVTPAHRHDSTQASLLMDQLPCKPEAYLPG